jgi:hypothetical protein
MNKFLIAAVAISLQVTVFAHSGTVQLRREAGGFAITVFTSPAPLSVGRADISVLIQAGAGLDPVLDSDVQLVLHSETSNVEFEAHPTRAQAQNKLLYAAPVIFSKPGKWHVGVVVSRNGQKTSAMGTLEVVPAGPRAVSYASYIAFPPVMVVLFVIRERLIYRRAMRRESRDK